MGNGFIQYGNLIICCLQTGNPGVLQSGSKGLRTGQPIAAWGQERWDVMSQLKEWARKKGWVLPFSSFCSIQALDGLTDAYPHWRGQPASLSPPIQMLTLSWNTHRDNPEVMTNLTTLWPVKLTHKIKHHKPLTLRGVYPREMKTCIDTKTCTQMSVTAWSILSED